MTEETDRGRVGWFELFYDLVIVVSDGAVLVCPKTRAQDVKNVVEALKTMGRQDLT